MAEETTTAPVGDDLRTDVPGVVYRLRPGPYKVAVLLDCPDPHVDLDGWATRIHGDLVEMELPEYPDPETIKALLANSGAPGGDLVAHTLIMGLAPVTGLDARLVWSRDYFAEGWIVDEASGQIDFREKVENCSVSRNELLVRVHDAVDGVPGQDIYGNKIPVEKAARVRVRCGTGVAEIAEDGATAFYAELDGRVRFADNTVTVDEVYHVAGDVGLATGNIHHTGSVTIDGDVLAGSTIETDGDVVVKGMIEEATVSCGGTLTVAGGILGGEGRAITAGCDIVAKYISEADVTAQGDVMITRQIFQSRVRCLGSVLVPGGRIAGGTTVALKGIRVATAGAPGASDTKLVSGVDYTLAKRLGLYRKKIERLETLVQPIEAALHNATAAVGTVLTAEARHIVESLARKRKMLHESIHQQYMYIDDMQRAADEAACMYIVMFKEVWSGTKIRLGESRTVVKNSIPRPRVALLQDDQAQIVPLGEANLPPEADHPRCPGSGEPAPVSAVPKPDPA